MGLPLQVFQKLQLLHYAEANFLTGILAQYFNEGIVLVLKQFHQLRISFWAIQSASAYYKFLHRPTNLKDHLFIYIHAHQFRYAHKPLLGFSSVPSSAVDFSEACCFCLTFKIASFCIRSRECHLFCFEQYAPRSLWYSGQILPLCQSYFSFIMFNSPLKQLLISFAFGNCVMSYALFLL